MKTTLSSLFITFSLLVSGLLASPWVFASNAVSSVRVITVGAADEFDSRRFVGRVDAISSVDLAFQVGGKIEQLSARQGEKVSKGTLLASIDPIDYQLALRRAEIEVTRAQRDRDRKAPLFERNAIPRAAYDESEDQLSLAQVARDAAERDLEHTRLYAPFDALISRRLQEQHRLVQAGTPIVRVQDVTELRVHISIPEDLIHLVNNPERFSAWLELPDRTSVPLEYREHVTEPDPVVQTYEVTLGREQLSDRMLLPGRTVTVKVEARTQLTQQLEVPVSALHGKGDGQFSVWVYDPDSGKVSARKVEVGPLQERYVRILAGLESGEQVVAAGGRHLHEGMRVKPFDRF